jgi:hypothetical protein
MLRIDFVTPFFVIYLSKHHHHHHLGEQEGISTPEEALVVQESANVVKEAEVNLMISFIHIDLECSCSSKAGSICIRECM